MQRFHLSTKQFEGILNSDDLFLEYFNVFLKIPVFPLSLSYDRLLGCFLTENKDEQDALFKRMFGATDTERECMLNWAREYRLAHFLETDLFREYKLCKLLRRSTEEMSCNDCATLPAWQSREQGGNWKLNLLFGFESWERSASLSVDSTTEETSQGIRPQETPMCSISSNENGDYHINATISALLPNLQASTLTEPSSETILVNNRSWEGYEDGGQPDEEKRSTYDGTETGRSSRRWFSLSGHTNEDLRSDIEWQNPLTGTKTTNEVEETCGEELIDELSHLGERQKMGIQQIKEFLLADREGMQDFLRFLLSTKGIHLVKFWMDCEAILSHIKDHLSDYYLAEHVQDVRTLERTYESFLPRSTHVLILNAVKCFSKAATMDKRIEAVEARDTETVVFLGCANLNRAQYAAVGRLRSYWLPRWMLHWEQRLLPMQLPPKPAWLSTAVDLTAGTEEIVALNIQCDLPAEFDGGRRELARHRLYPAPRSTLSWNSEDSFQAPKPVFERNLELLPFLCRLILAWSLPSDVGPVVTLLSDGSTDWKVLQAHLPRERARTLARLYSKQNDPINNSGSRIEIVPEDVVFERLRAAVFADFKCGRPFFKFASRLASQAQINSFYFIEKLMNLFTATYCAQAGRTDIAALSWVLLNQFIKPTAKFGLELPEALIRPAERQIMQHRGVVPIDILKPILRHCLERLKDLWFQFLRQDAFDFTVASRRHLDLDEPPESPSAFDLFVEPGRIMAHLRDTRVKTEAKKTAWELMTPRERKQRLAALAEITKSRERQRRLLLQSIHHGKSGKPTKQRHTKLDHREKSELSLEDEDEWSLELTSSVSEEASIDVPQLNEVLSKRQLLLLFQMYLGDPASPLRSSISPEENQKLLDSQILLLKIVDFLALPNPENRLELARMRSEKALEIHSAVQKLADLPQNLRQLLEKDKEHSKTSVLLSLEQHLIGQLNQPFGDWIKVRSAEAGISPRSFAHLRGKQRLESAQLNISGISKPVYRVEPTPADRQELTKVLESCVFHPLTFQVLLFYQYLARNGVRTGRNFAENDLIFYIESLRFKELVLDKAEPSLISHKLACIRSAFLESAFPPSIQITLKDETGNRLLRGINKTLALKGTPAQATLMDEARMKIFRELLPFWAAFRRNPSDRTQFQSAAQMNLGLSFLSGIQSEVLAQRFNTFRDWTVPPPPSVLPFFPEKVQSTGVSCSLAQGISWRALPRRGLKPERTHEPAS